MDTTSALRPTAGQADGAIRRGSELAAVVRHIAAVVLIVDADARS